MHHCNFLTRNIAKVI